MNDECKSDLEMQSVTGRDLASVSLRYKVGLLVNLGLLLSVGVSVLVLLPVPLLFPDRFSVRLVAGLAVLAFLDASFWLSGWPGSAVGISLLGLAIVFMMVVGLSLGLVGTVLSLLMGTLVILLMLSDVPLLKDDEWSTRGPLSVYIGIAANAIVVALSVALWFSFGRVSLGP